MYLLQVHHIWYFAGLEPIQQAECVPCMDRPAWLELNDITYVCSEHGSIHSAFYEAQ